MVNRLSLNSLLGSGSTFIGLHSETYHQISDDEKRPIITRGKDRTMNIGDVESLGEVSVENTIEGYSFNHSLTIAEVDRALLST